MIQDIVTTQVDQLVLANKRNAWANMGEAIYTGELALQARAQAKLIGVTLPTNISEVPDAEAMLKELKGEMNRICEERKKITSRLDDVTGRLMLPEKSMIEPIKSLEAEIIKIKKADAEDRSRKQAREDELKACREFLITSLAGIDAQYKRLITEKVSKAYEYALGDGNIQLDDLGEFMHKAATKFTEKDFAPAIPSRQLVNVTQEEYAALATEHFQVDANSYLLAYVVELEKKFSDFAVALNNKSQALERAKQEESAKLAAISEEQTNKEIASQLSMVSEDLAPVYGPAVKDLKEVFEVDMPESVESVIKIMAAFTANIQLCLPKLRVTKWFAFTPSQAAGALSKVKNDDNAFSPTGITFKKVDKL